MTLTKEEATNKVIKILEDRYGIAYLDDISMNKDDPLFFGYQFTYPNDTTDQLLKDLKTIEKELPGWKAEIKEVAGQPRALALVFISEDIPPIVEA